MMCRINSYAKQAIKKVGEERPSKFVSDSLSWGFYLTKKYYKKHIKKDIVANPRQYIYVSPQEIETMLTRSEYVDWVAGEEINDEIVDLYDPEKARFIDRYNLGLIMDGDWDKHNKPHDKDQDYRSFKQVFIHNEDWEDTEYVKTALKKINRGHEASGYKSTEAFKKGQLEYVERLYTNIKKEGYKKQSQMKNDGSDFYHEVSVNIGRDGDLIFNNSGGHHRLALSKIIGLKEIPVIVIVRHSEWQEIREKIKSTEKKEYLDKDLEKYLGHPDISPIIKQKNWRNPID